MWLASRKTENARMPNVEGPPQDAGQGQGEQRVHAEPEAQGEVEVMAQGRWHEQPAQGAIGEGDIAARQAVGERQGIDRIGPGRLQTAAQRVADAWEEEQDEDEPTDRGGPPGDRALHARHPIRDLW